MLSILDCSVQKKQISPLYIEGVQIDNLFESLSNKYQIAAKERGIALQFDVIAWSPLIVATDRHQLIMLLDDIIDYSLSLSAGEKVIIQAYPSFDSIFVSFHISFVTMKDSPETVKTFSRVRSESWQKQIKQMSGEFHHFQDDDGTEHISFLLVHWITENEGCEIRRHLA
jgi:predicted PurR-regulated permease PerM